MICCIAAGAVAAVSAGGAAWAARRRGDGAAPHPTEPAESPADPHGGPEPGGAGDAGGEQR